MSKKILSKIVLSTSIVATAAASLATISCGETESKEILIAVDGVQKNYYDKAIEMFNKTESAKKGFTIKTINKDVWGALDTTTVGVNDTKVVPDIFYAPQDRITDLASKNAVSDLNQFSPKLFDRLTKAMGATEEDKNQIKAFGTVIGINASTQTPEEKLFGIRHNTEGIIMASSKSIEDVRKDLEDPKNDTMLELVKQGRAFFRLQDFWYGNGILGGVLDKDTLSKLLYVDNGKLTSGLLEDNKYHDKFKEAVNVISEIFYTIYEASYIKSADEYKNTEFGKRGISQADLKALLVSDMGAVNNKVFELMSTGKLEYGMIGTWDVQVAQKAGNAKSFLNFDKINEKYSYKQASGSWSYMINIRNNSASDNRREAIIEFLECLYKAEPFFEYFKSDSKVPFTNSLKKGLESKVQALSIEENKAFEELYKKLKYTNAKEFEDAYDAFVGEVNKLKDASETNDTWSDNNGATGANELALQKILGAKAKDIAKKFALDEQKVIDYAKKLDNKKGTGLRNVIAGIFGLELSKVEGNGQEWQLGFDKIKEDAAKDDFFKDTLQTENSFHIRKLEKLIFGANGDQGTEVSEVLAKYQEAIKDNTVDKLIEEEIEKAKQISLKLAKTPVDEAKIKEVVEQYINGKYLAPAYVRNFGENLFKESKFISTKDSSIVLEIKEVS
ncbi:hypothetical protein, partial [Mycoplasma elephantis]|uniref:hypothetical protein n=1 Tax=Mycoplasma elephantis TaxID=114882 RepID=UPI0004869682